MYGRVSKHGSNQFRVFKGNKDIQKYANILKKY